MKQIKWILGILVSAVLISCGSGKAEYKSKSVQGMFTFDMPTYLEEMDLENPDAILEYGNGLKEHYVLVISETTDELEGLDIDVDSYSDFTVNFLKESLDNSKIQKVNSEIKDINGLSANLYKVWGNLAEINQDIFYYIAILKSDSRYYSFYTWTLESREDRYTKTMEHMIESFKEL